MTMPNLSRLQIHDYAEPHTRTRLDRHCPRCHYHSYHWAKRNPTTNAVLIECNDCGHDWTGRFKKDEWNV